MAEQKLTSEKIIKKLETLNPQDSASVEKITKTFESFGRSSLRNIEAKIENLLKTAGKEKIKVLEEILEKVKNSINYN